MTLLLDHRLLKQKEQNDEINHDVTFWTNQRSPDRSPELPSALQTYRK